MAKKKQPARDSSKTDSDKEIDASSKKPSSQAEPTDLATSSKPADSNRNAALTPVIGIGASAGGLEAFVSFFNAMPCDSGLAFVLVVHLDPNQISLLPELLQKRTEMTVHQIRDGMTVEPNCVYVIPPNKDLAMLNGALQLMELSQSRGVNLPIDNFFRSLANDQGRNAACIILSGTGTDGTLGVKAIKGEIGMVMAQDEESAKYGGMPRSAISTGLVDYVLPPQEMPAQLISYINHAFTGGTRGLGVENPIPHALHKIYVILRSQTDHDFSLYKKNTICRRIERRMNVHQIDEVSDYVRYLQESEREVGILFKELLIGVTSFFRDPEAFRILESTILPKRMKDKPDNEAFRVWIAGCSSGEEAYSVAIILHECMERIGRRFHVQIFATDIDETAINVARAGLYPASISADVRQDRLRRYFTKEDDGQYRLKKLIREMLVFAPQNVIKDPPFTKLDLLCCRNLLIYLGTELQRKLFPVFHYSLRPGGILFLGSSETIGLASDLYTVEDKKWKIYCQRPGTEPTRPSLSFPIQPDMSRANKLGLPDAVQQAEEINALQLVESILHQSHTPPCVVINDSCNVIYIHGRTGKFLEPAEGKASVNLLDMARPGLRNELAKMVGQVTTNKQEVVSRGHSVRHNGSKLTVDLTVRPILEQSAMRGLMMVVFDEPKSPLGKTANSLQPPNENAIVTLSELEKELQYSKETLQTTIEELETSNEELKSANEELQSTNEELQSTNEELETSKEELQSLNEESETVNAELQARIDELSKNNDDMKNLLDSTAIATVFVDTELRVRRFTPKMTEIIPLAATDVGRPIGHLASSLKDVNIADQAKLVLDDLAVRETEAESNNDQSFVMRVRPYRTTANVIDGVVITFEDITARKRAEAERERLALIVSEESDIQRESQHLYQTLFEIANDAMVLIRLEADHVSFAEFNNQAHEHLGYTREEFSKLSVSDIFHNHSDKDVLQQIKTVHREGSANFETEHQTKDGEIRRVLMKGKAITTNGKDYILSTWCDVG